MNDISNKIEALTKEHHSLTGQHKLVEKQVLDIKDRLEGNSESKALYQKCIEVLDIAQTILQKKMKEGFETVSTDALQSIFGSGHSLELEFDKRGTNPEVDVYIKAPDMQENHGIEYSNAGGHKDLIALILRLVVLSFAQPNGKTPLGLDEPFSQLGEGNLEDTARCLKSIINKFERQIIMVSHNGKGFLQYADNAINFEEL